MAMGTYKLKRLLAFIIVGIVGSIIAPFLFFMSFPILGLFLFSITVGAILALSGYLLTGTNPWIKAVQGDGLIVVDINSTGVGKFYVAKVKNNPIGGIDLNIDFGSGKEETRVYDRKVTHRMHIPFPIVMQPWKKKNTQILPNGESEEKIEQRIAFSMPKEDYDKSAWHYDNLTMLFYDSETGMFLNKPYMREQEKQMQAEYLSLNEWRELKELNKTMRDFTRNTFDLFGQKFGGILASPMVKILIIVVIVVIIIVGLIAAFPQLSSMILPPVKTAIDSTSQVVTPLGK